MTWIRVASTSDVATGQMMSVEVDGEVLALYHTDADEWYVTSDVCTHAGESLTSGTFEGGIVACPKHGGKFDVQSGKAAAMPCVIPLETFPVEVRENDVYLDFD